MAKVYADLWSHRFSEIGGLYLCGRQHRLPQDVNRSPPGHSKFFSHYFVETGRLSSIFFLSERPLYVPGDRGPFNTTFDWLSAKLAFEGEYVRTGVELARTVTDKALFENNEVDNTLLKFEAYLYDVCDDFWRCSRVRLP